MGGGETATRRSCPLRSPECEAEAGLTHTSHPSTPHTHAHMVSLKFPNNLQQCKYGIILATSLQLHPQNHTANQPDISYACGPSSRSVRLPEDPVTDYLMTWLPTLPDDPVTTFSTHTPMSTYDYL